ncbi:MAG TPA: AI-2E family transporter [Steroidobacteraceae bacterium]|jgi:predicted PurR-regulated permease PerM|nr:AI-2E family transporter [Steroidobacteraceae bacterium]
MSAPQPAPGREPPRERERWALLTPSRSLTPVVLALGAAAFLLHLLQNILLPFVIAAVTAYLCAPLVDWLTARTRLPRRLVALCLLAALMGLAALLGLLGLPPLLRQVQGLLADLHGAVADFLRAMIGTHSVQLLGSTLDAQRLADLIVGGLQHEMTGAQLLRVVGWGAAGLFGFMLVWVLIGYFLLDSQAIAAGLLWLVPPRRRAQAEHLWHELDPLLRRYFIGVAGVVAYATAVAYLGLGLVLGLHHALVLALLTGVLEVIPVIGPVAAAVMAGLVAVQQAATTWDVWAYAGYATALRLSIDQLVGPIVLGNAARVHPVVVIFGFLAGGALFGIVGMILAVPLALLVKVALAVLYREAR